jgi:uncharacterized membrane protein YbhN (UPF0104 family)
LLSLLLALSATVVVGYFVLRQLKWSDLTALLAGSDWRYLALGFATYSGANVLRALRFRALNSDLIPTGVLLRTVLIQNLLNTFLPLRAGEASYLYMVHRTGTVNPGENVGSLLGARVLDLLAALSIPALILPLSRASSLGSVPLAWLALLPLLGTLGLALAIWKASRLGELCRGRAARARGWLARGLLFAADVLGSLARLQRGSLLGRVVALTLGCWLLIYICGYFTMLGVGLSLPVFDCVFAYSFPVVVSMMPFYMLGGFGVFEGSIGVGLNLVGVPLGPAMAAGLALHVAELLFILVPGPLTLLPGLWSRSR